MLALMQEQTASQLVSSRLTAKSARKWPAPRMAQPLLRLWKAWSNVTVLRWSVTCCLACRVRMRKPGEKIWLLPAISVSTASISMRSMSCPIHRWARPWKMGVLPCPLRQNVAIFICKGVTSWTKPVGAVLVTATGAVPHANAISITC